MNAGALSRSGRLLFPDPPRTLPGRRWIKLILRAAHVLLAGLLVGAVLFELDAEQRDRWLHATIGSGALLLLLDLHESAAFVCQVRGLVVLTKIGIVIWLDRFGSYQAAVLCVVVLASVIFSHAPASVRYRVLFGQGRIRGATSSG